MTTKRFKYLQRFRQELRCVGFSKAGADKIVQKIRKNKDNDGCFERACEQDYTFSELLGCSFFWHETPEGQDFWYNLHTTLELRGGVQC